MSHLGNVHMFQTNCAYTCSEEVYLKYKYFLDFQIVYTKYPYFVRIL